jgi:hypothetical protein
MQDDGVVHGLSCVSTYKTGSEELTEADPSAPSITGMTMKLLACDGTVAEVTVGVHDTVDEIISISSSPSTSTIKRVASVVLALIGVRPFSFEVIAALSFRRVEANGITMIDSGILRECIEEYG